MIDMPPDAESDPIDDMIDRVERYVLNRQIHVAEFLAREFLDEFSSHPMQRSGFAILSIIMSYFEMVEQFASGESSRNRSAESFSRGFRGVYSCSTMSDEQIRSIYRWVRCGMYHGGMPDNQIHLSRHFSSGFAFESGVLGINPGLAVREIREHFEGFISELRYSIFELEQRQLFWCYCQASGLDRATPDHPTQTDVTAGPFDEI